MKKINFLWIILVIIMAGILSFKPTVGGIVRGAVVPADGAARIWAISGTDTFKTTANNMGAFEMINVRPGTYRVLVEANPPYQNVAKDNIQVVEGAVTDAGDFKVTR